MSLIVPVTKTLAIIIMMTLSSNCVAEKMEKRWPDLTCHEKNFKQTGTEAEEKFVFFHNMYKETWDECVKREKDMGICAKVCYMQSNNMVHRRNDNKVDVEVWMGFMSHFWDTFSQSSAPKGKELDQIEKKMERDLIDCSKKHTEIENLTFEEPCDKWNPFISCVEKAFGCS